MRTVLVLVLIEAVCVLVGCSSTESFLRPDFNFGNLDRIAVTDVEGQVKSEAAKNQIADFFVMELLKKGYVSVERVQVQSILKEQEFQSSELTSQKGIARAGQILNVPAILVINVPTYGEEISITAKLLDVEDGTVLWMGNGVGSTGKLLATLAGAAAGAGVGVATTGEDDQVIGGVAGGVLGGVVGRALSPQEATKAKELIGKICKNLPYKK